MIALVAIAAEAAATAAAADAARAYDGWVSVDPGHRLRLFYAGKLAKVVPLAQLGPWDLEGLQYAVLEENDGHVEPIRRAPPPVAAPPPPGPPPPVSAQPPASTGPPAPVRQAGDSESPD